MVWLTNDVKTKIAYYLGYPQTHYYLEDIIGVRLTQITYTESQDIIDELLSKLDECESNLQTEAASGSFEKLDVIKYGSAGGQTGWLRERLRLIGLLIDATTIQHYSSFINVMPTTTRLLRS